MGEVIVIRCANIFKAYRYCAYITGYTSSGDFPTVNPYQAGKTGITNSFVSKLSSSGSSKRKENLKGERMRFLRG